MQHAVLFLFFKSSLRLFLHSVRALLPLVSASSLLEGSAAARPYGRALETRGGLLVLMEANSPGHLPGLRLCSGLTDHSVEGHSSTCPPGQQPETIASSCGHHTVGFSFFWLWWKHYAPLCRDSNTVWWRCGGAARSLWVKPCVFACWAEFSAARVRSAWGWM